MESTKFSGKVWRHIYGFHLMHHWRPVSNLAVVGFWGFAIWDHIFHTITGRKMYALAGRRSQLRRRPAKEATVAGESDRPLAGGVAGDRRRLMHLLFGFSFAKLITDCVIVAEICFFRRKHPRTFPLRALSP